MCGNILEIRLSFSLTMIYYGHTMIMIIEATIVYTEYRDSNAIIGNQISVFHVHRELTLHSLGDQTHQIGFVLCPYLAECLALEQILQAMLRQRGVPL